MRRCNQWKPDFLYRLQLSNHDFLFLLNFTNHGFVGMNKWKGCKDNMNFWLTVSLITMAKKKNQTTFERAKTYEDVDRFA